MNTDDGIERIYIELLDKMTLAGWLKAYSKIDGKGFHLTWTEEGTAKSNFLKLIAERLSLCTDSKAPLIVDATAHGRKLPDELDGFQLDPQIAKAWCECIAQIGIPGDETRLYLLVQMATALAPSSDTKTIS